MFDGKRHSTADGICQLPSFATTRLPFGSPFFSSSSENRAEFTEPGEAGGVAQGLLSQSPTHRAQRGTRA